MPPSVKSVEFLLECQIESSRNHRISVDKYRLAVTSVVNRISKVEVVFSTRKKVRDTKKKYKPTLLK